MIVDILVVASVKYIPRYEGDFIENKITLIMYWHGKPVGLIDNSRKPNKGRFYDLEN